MKNTYRKRSDKLCCNRTMVTAFGQRNPGNHFFTVPKVSKSTRPQSEMRRFQNFAEEGFEDFFWRRGGGARWEKGGQFSEVV